MILADHEIRELLFSRDLQITGLMPEDINAHSVDIHLSNSFLARRSGTVIDLDNPGSQKYVPVPAYDPSGAILIYPGQFILGSSLERISLPANLPASLFGVSTNARCGLQIHSTGAWIDAGFEGEITLEISNNESDPILLRPGMRIGQLVFHRSLIASYEYSGRYQGQTGATPPRGMKE